MQINRRGTLEFNPATAPQDIGELIIAIQKAVGSWEDELDDMMVLAGAGITVHSLDAAFDAGKEIDGAGSLANAMLVGDGTRKLQFYSDGTRCFVGTAAGDLILAPATGNVGIGTTAPDELLHVAGTVKAQWLKTDATTIFNNLLTHGDFAASDAVGSWHSGAPEGWTTTGTRSGGTVSRRNNGDGGITSLCGEGKGSAVKLYAEAGASPSSYARIMSQPMPIRDTDHTLIYWCRSSVASVAALRNYIIAFDTLADALAYTSPKYGLTEASHEAVSTTLVRRQWVFNPRDADATAQWYVLSMHNWDPATTCDLYISTAAVYEGDVSEGEAWKHSHRVMNEHPGLTTSFTEGGTTLTFTNGILTEVA